MSSTGSRNSTRTSSTSRSPRPPHSRRSTALCSHSSSSSSSSVRLHRPVPSSESDVGAEERGDTNRRVSWPSVRSRSLKYKNVGMAPEALERVDGDVRLPACLPASFIPSSLQTTARPSPTPIPLSRASNRRPRRELEVVEELRAVRPRRRRLDVGTLAGLGGQLRRMRRLGKGGGHAGEADIMHRGWLDPMHRHSY